MSGEAVVLAAVEAATAESRRRAGEWIACRAGCAECCHAAFAITALDAARLRAGLAAAEPETAARIRARAAVYAAAVRDTFPGEWASGRLTDDEAWRDWFFARMKGGLACPVLDEARGECALYEHRPVACRLHGHLIQIGGEETSRCELCFVGATAAEMEACRVHVADVVAGDGGEDGQTIVALALAGDGPLADARGSETRG